SSTATGRRMRRSVVSTPKWLATTKISTIWQLLCARSRSAESAAIWTTRNSSMRHRKAGRKLGRNPSQRQALFRQLAISMILHERITTTEAKAKDLRPVIEKLVTIAREDSSANRHLIMSKIDNPLATTKLFEVIAPRYESTNGGYTRISKLEPRRGDAAKM